MRNTITLNGVESSTIPGLLIQELPAISKPLMRTEVETIDGRDGDITTDLGFSAYDKQITIGLFGEFDINQVIAYFNSKGTVVFSNEPDKFYNYEIVDQIDFERLVRYRTATVTMHCQPFKYSTTEGADILSTNDNFATLNQSLNTDTGFYTYSSNVQNDITAIRSGGSGGKFFAVFSVPVVQGVTYYFSGNGSKNISMYGYTNQLRGTSAGISGKGFNGYFTYTATFTGTMVLGFYSNISTEIFIRNFKISNQSTSTVSGEGTNLVLEGTAEAPFSRFDLKGDIKQDSYTGKNLFKLSSQSTQYGITLTKNSDGTVNIHGTNTYSGETLYTAYVPASFFEDGATYTLSNTKELVAGLSARCEVYNDATWLRSFVSTSTRTAALNLSNGNRIRIAIAIARQANVNIDNIGFQLEKSSSATSFERYVGGVPAPNPEYPQNVRVVTGNQTVRIAGKNLYNPTTILNRWQSTATLENGKLTVNGTASSGVCFATTDYYDFKANITYTFSYKYTGSFLRMVFLTADSVAVGGTSTNGRLTITPTEDIRLKPAFYVTTGTDTTMLISDMQLEKSSTASDFNVFQGQDYSIGVGSFELAASQEYFYKSGDKWYKHKTIGKKIFDGSENWSGSWQDPDTPDYWQVYLTQADFTDNYIATGTDNAKCSHFRRSGMSIWGIKAYCFAINASATYRLQFKMPKTFIDNVADWKSWLNSNHITLYWTLNTPVEEEILSETLKGQLDAISEANAYRGQTNIDVTASTGNLPHIIAAEVAADPSGTITNSGNIYSKPKLTIFGSGNVGVYLNGVQMFQIALGTNDHITIDTALMEAYKDNLQTLKNRSVTGDYNNFKLPVGDSEISFSGTVTMCVVENYSRWL